MGNQGKRRKTRKKHGESRENIGKHGKPGKT